MFTNKSGDIFVLIFDIHEHKKRIESAATSVARPPRYFIWNTLILKHDRGYQSTKKKKKKTTYKISNSLFSWNNAEKYIDETIIIKVIIS